MVPQDAKAIRERLNTVVTALVLLEADDNPRPGQVAAASRAFDALQEIAQLVTADEQEQKGQHVPADLEKLRARLRRETYGNRPVEGKRRHG